MAEYFSNYCSKFTCPVPSSLSDVVENVIVPKAGQGLPSTGTGSRLPGTIAQLHSIYITQEVSNRYSDPTTRIAYINLKVKDGSSSYYVAHNVMVLPHSAFYIEKTITLLAQQQLILEFTTLNTAGCNLDVVVSGVDISS